MSKISNSSSKVITTEEIMSTTIRVSSETRKKISKMAAKFTLKDGIERTPDDIIKMLIEEYEEKEKA
jgi:predicted transcriptional regulator